MDKDNSKEYQSQPYRVNYKKIYVRAAATGTAIVGSAILLTYILLSPVIDMQAKNEKVPAIHRLDSLYYAKKDSAAKAYELQRDSIWQEYIKNNK